MMSTTILSVDLKIAVAFVVFTGAGILIIRWTLHGFAKSALESPFRQQLSAAQAAINSLSIEEARERSIFALSNSSRFQTIRSNSPHRELPPFEPILQEFFRNFRSVSAVKGEFKISEEWFGDPPAATGKIKIGTDLDFCEYLAALGSEEIVEAYAGERTRHRSIHHLILLEDWLLTPDREVSHS